MAEMQKVSWRTVSYAALGTAAVIAATIGIVHSDGVRPTSLKSSAATRWLVYQPQHLLVLADGLSGHVLAKIDADPKSDATGEFALQGAAGAFLVSPSLGSVRAISTANLQLGTPQPVGSLTESIDRRALGVGSNGLTVVNPQVPEANIVAAGDVTRRITITKADNALVARDGSMWLFTQTQATHVNVDETKKTFPLRGTVAAETTVGSRGATLDTKNSTLHWLGGGDVSLASIPNLADAVLQIKGDDARCVWLGADDTLACVGSTGIDQIVHVAGLNLQVGDRLAVTESVAAVVRKADNQVQRIDLDNERLLTTGNPQGVPTSRAPTVVATGGMIWIDDEQGKSAWVINPFGSSIIHKDDTAAPTVDAQGLVTDPGTGPAPDPNAAGNVPGSDTEVDHLDHNGVDNSPTAVDDSVTARAGDTVTIPVTANDWDPDGDAIALLRVGDTTKAAHGTADVLDGASVTYVPDLAFSGTDEFDYTITDEHGNEVSATVHLRLFPADSPNQPPITTPDRVTTRLRRAVTIDVLANDIDPERDTLKVATFTQTGTATITDIIGPSGLTALKYDPPSTPGFYTFFYQAADPQGGTSQKTKVTVEVLGDDAENRPPKPKPEAVRLPVGKSALIDVKANDTDPDGDELLITGSSPAAGVDATVRSQRLDIAMKPGAEPLSVVRYTVSDQTGLEGHSVEQAVLVVRIDDNAPNRAPVANADTDRVVVGNSVKIPVTANDADPEHDPITLLDVTQPAGGVGTAAVEGSFVRFTPNLPNITESTTVTFTYKIGDGQGNVATGNVTVTVLTEALPGAPFARDDFADTFTDKPIIIPVLANDTDPSGGTPSIVGTPVCTNDGTTSVTSDQRVTFVPPAGQTGIFRCKYKVGNGQGFAEAWIIVTVTDPPAGNHDPQIIESQLAQFVDIGQTLTLNAASLATDIDGNSLTFASASLSTPGIGSINFTAKSPTLTYTAPLKSASAIPNVVNIDITITDGNDGYDQGTISITINDPTPAPRTPVAPPITRSTTLDVPVPPIDVIAESRDANPGDTLTLVSATREATSANAAVNANPATGMVQITPQEVGTILVTYVVQNVDKQVASGRITVTVAAAPPTNPAPIAVADDLVVSSGGSGSVELMRNDSNIADTGDNPSVTLVNKPPASFGTVSLVNGILTLIAAPDVVEKHATINYNLSDGVNPAVQGDVRLTILACGESPPAVRSATLFTPYVTPINIDLGQYVDSGHIVAGSISGAGLTGPTGTYTPPELMNDSVTVTYTVANGCGQSAQGVLTIDVNRAPVANSVSRELPAGTSLTLAATDLASDDEQLTIKTLDGNPAWVASNGQLLTATPALGTASGVYAFTATMADPGGLTAVVTINLTITNLPPTAVADAYYTDTNLFTFDPTVNDFDTEPGPLSITVITPSEHVVSVTDKRLVTVTLDHGVNKFDYTIADSGGLTSSSTITITSNRKPTVGDAAGTTTDPSIDVNLEPIDPDGDSLSAACDALPPESFDVQIISDPEPGVPEAVRVHVMHLETGSVSVVFSCTFADPFGAKASAQLSLTFN